MPAHRPFRIAHLSDLHLTAADGASRSEPKLFGALKGMNGHFRILVNSPQVQSSDLVLVTGDVTDRGDIKSWELFWSAVNAAGLKDRMLVVPGNHDVCCLGARLPGRRRKYWDNDMARLRRGLRLGDQPTKFPWAHQPDSRVVIFGLNSNRLGNFSAVTNAMGDVDYFQLKSLAELMHKHRHVPVKIVAMHHSPNIPEEATAIRRGQRPFSKLDRIGHQVPQDQRRALNLLCISHKVKLLLHGHLHMAEERRLTNVRYIGATSSTEPRQGESGACLQFPVYTVSGKDHRVFHKSEEIAL